MRQRAKREDPTTAMNSAKLKPSDYKYKKLKSSVEYTLADCYFSKIPRTSLITPKYHN